ncbi:MAG: hypothetical protein PHR11_01550 [Candidatus Omnitrophica bacterium]|nr:hypothetical protein [Candidatus Omnitrophota bacterium]
MKKKMECRVCGAQSFYTGSCFGFMPVACCEETVERTPPREKKRVHQAKK